MDDAVFGTILLKRINTSSYCSKYFFNPKEGGTILTI